MHLYKMITSRLLEVSSILTLDAAAVPEKLFDEAWLWRAVDEIGETPEELP